MAIGVFALAAHPRKTVKQNIGKVDIAVTFGGVTFLPRQTLYADEDDASVPDRPLH